MSGLGARKDKGRLRVHGEKEGESKGKEADDAARKGTFDSKCYIPCLFPKSLLFYSETNGRERERNSDQKTKQSVDSLIPPFFTLGYNIKSELPVAFSRSPNV